jgi:hypothetical protein
MQPSYSERGRPASRRSGDGEVAGDLFNSLLSRRQNDGAIIRMIQM